MSNVNELEAKAKEAGISVLMIPRLKENILIKEDAEVLSLRVEAEVSSSKLEAEVSSSKLEAEEMPAQAEETEVIPNKVDEVISDEPCVEEPDKVDNMFQSNLSETPLPQMTEMPLSILPPPKSRARTRTSSPKCSRTSTLKIKLPLIRSARTSPPQSTKLSPSKSIEVYASGNIGRILSQKASYNLRSKNSCEGLKYHNKSKKYKLKKKSSAPIWIPKESKLCFRDKLLTYVDLKTYHQAQEEFAQKIIDSTFTIEKSQIDRFIYQSKRFIAMSWLTTLRIFEYQPNKEDYLEVKRMPYRYIKLSPHLLTSIHYCDSNFYLAYLWGSTEDGEGGTSPFIETRDLHGTLIGTPRYYEHVITSIYSDQNFIYVMTVTNTIYVHQRRFFEHICYQVNFNDFTDHRLVKAFINSPTYESFSKFPFIAATRFSLLFSQFNVLNHKLLYKHSYDDGFKIISIDQYKKNKKNPLYLIHRNSSKINFFNLDETLTKIEFGQYNRNSESIPLKLLRSLEFTYCILQVQIHEDKIYLFGYSETIGGNNHFEIGCISASDLMPQRTIIVPDGVGIDSRILVHDDNIVVVKNSQDFVTIENYQTLTQRLHECIKCRVKIPKIDIQKHEQHGHQTIFSNYKSRLLN